jgi:hypothetical protein
MLVRFTKRADGRHRLTVVRDDGSASQARMVPGLGADAIPHDLLHALVEQTLGFTRGVYGTVNTGIEVDRLLDPAQKPANEGQPELMLSEIVTTLLQGELAYVGVGPDDFTSRLRQQCDEHGLPVHPIDPDRLRELRRLRDEHQRLWRELASGETLEVAVVTSRPPGAKGSAPR